MNHLSVAAFTNEKSELKDKTNKHRTILFFGFQKTIWCSSSASSPGMWASIAKDQVTEYAIHNYEENHDSHIFPELLLLKSPLLQETIAIQQTNPKQILEAFSTQVRVFVDKKRLERILEQGQIMHEDPVFGYVLLGNEIAREQKEATHETCYKRIPHDEIWGQGA